MVGSYTRELGPGRLDLTAAYNYNKTTVTSGSLSASATQKRLFEEARPQHNLTGTAIYAFGKFELLGRVRYYGKWTDSTGNATGDIFQAFGGITLADVAVTYHATDNMAVKLGGGERLRHLSGGSRVPGQPRPRLFAERALRHQRRAVLRPGDRPVLSQRGRRSYSAAFSWA